MKSLVRLLSFTRPFILQMLWAMVLGFATVAANVGLLGTSAYLIAHAALQPSVSELQVAIVGVRFFGLARGVLRYLERMQTHTVNFHILGQIRTWFYAALEPLPPGRMHSFRRGDLYSRVMEDIDTLDNYFVRAFAPMVEAITATLAIGVFTGRLAPGTQYIVMGGMLLSGLGAPLLAYRLGGRPGAQSAAARGQLSGLVLDFYAGMRDLLAYDQAENWKTRFNSTQAAWDIHQRQSASAQALADGVVMVGSYMTVLGLLVYTIPLVQTGQLSGVLMVVLALSTLAVFEVVGWLNPAAAQLRSCAQAAERLMEVVDTQPVKATRVDEPNLMNGYEIDIIDLMYVYPEQRNWHLGIMDDFTLAEGSRIGLVGPSGCGKTTLLNILLRNLDCMGVIRLGSAYLDSYTPEEIHTLMAAPMQADHIFNDTVFNNLAISGEEDETRMMNALRAVELRQWVERLPKGLNTMLGSLGVGLSGGERTRLALARSLLRNPKIFLLDEPTIHLDIQTEQRVMKTIFEVTRGKSVIWATHRLVGMELLDHICVLNKGEIVEQGSHSRLMDKNELYARMWNIQRRII